MVPDSSPPQAGQQDKSTAAAPRGSWFRRETISLAEIAIQVFSVVLGILLAWGIGNWSSSRESARKVTEAQAAIRAEIRANRARLEQTTVYQAELTKAVQAAAASSAPPKRCTDVPSWRGLQTALLLHSAYDNAIAAGVFTSMELADGQNIAAIYATQERYVVFSNKSLDWMELKLLDEGEVAACAGVLLDLSAAGASLVANYDAYLASDPSSTVKP